MNLLFLNLLHIVPDTEGQDADEERFWPDAYKQLLRKKVKKILDETFRNECFFQSPGLHFHDPMNDDTVSSFVSRMIIGAENGSDETFEKLYISFSKGLPLPVVREIRHPLITETMFPEQIQNEIEVMIVKDFSKEHMFEHWYEDHYADEFDSIGQFIEKVAKAMLIGMRNGAERMYRNIFWWITLNSSLPPARRLPRGIRHF